jgi:membrane associated rhomboid family serine protease
MIVILMAVNAVLMPFSPALTEAGFALDLGNGLHPIQWVTHNFLHGGLMHLIGNLIFLWAYGIIVEGKLGWWRTLLVYLIIGTLHGALVQTLCLGMETDPEFPVHALGASAVIFGLLGLCMVWAPANCISVVYFFGWFFRGQWDAPIWIFAIIQALFEGWDLLIGGLLGSVVGSAMGHLSGFGWGFALGVVMFKLDWVDCEGWDLFTVLRKKYVRGTGLGDKAKTPRYLKARGKKKTVKATAGREEVAEELAPEDRAASSLERLRKRLDAGETRAALDLYLRSAPSWKQWGWGMPEADLMRLIKAVQAAKLDNESVPLMFEYARRFPDRADRVRLRLALVLIDVQQRPARAMRVLDELPPGGLGGDLEKARLKLVAKAQAMIDDGVLELEGDD